MLLSLKPKWSAFVVIGRSLLPSLTLSVILEQPACDVLLSNRHRLRSSKNKIYSEIAVSVIFLFLSFISAGFGSDTSIIESKQKHAQMTH